MRAVWVLLLEITMCVATANANELTDANPAPKDYPKDGYQWKRVVDADGIEDVRIHQVTMAELLKKQGQIGPVRGRPRGYTELKRNKDTGAMHADIYVIDPNDTVTIEHELRHARGWTH